LILKLEEALLSIAVSLVLGYKTLQLFKYKYSLYVLHSS